MNGIKTLFALLILFAPFGAFGAHNMADHGSHSAHTQNSVVSEGEIRGANLEAGTVLLKHGDIEALNMRGMTMQFSVKDKTALSGLKTGDRVVFTLEKEGADIVVTDIRRAP
ncbi:MAG: copper-binding protein [Helicobacteraceae bacterium]|jgi:Cu(I)/Ag(I) efflux system protein CusF|nr:copper-binding protein [Helicobacteraceae bacterium]